MYGRKRRSQYYREIEENAGEAIALKAAWQRGILAVGLQNGDIKSSSRACDRAFGSLVELSVRRERLRSRVAESICCNR